MRSTSGATRCGFDPPSGACLRSRWRRSSSVSPPLRSLRRTRASRAGSTRRSSSSPGSRAGCGSATRGRTCRSPSGLLGLVALGTVAWLVFRPLAAPRALPDPEVRHAVEDLVRRHGHDTLAFFKLRGDQHYLFTDDGTAFLGYRVESGVMLCAGDPIGRPAAVPGLLDKAASVRPGSRPAARRSRGERGSRPGLRGARPAAPLPRGRGHRRDGPVLPRGPRDPQGAPVGDSNRESRVHLFDGEALRRARRDVG